jgi:glycosyltransferase involved in cell wall biosynthesis
LPKKFILYVGNIQPRKNLPRLIEAFRQLKQKGLPHQLVLVGAAQWAVSDTFRAATRDGLEREVIFTGYVPERDLPWFYRAAEVLAYPSLLEGFGLPLVEAMACGTPVVTSNSVAIRETVGDAAIVVDPLNTQAIADGIHTVISDTAVRQHLIAKGLARAQQFTWAETARCTLQVYEEVGAARKI